MLSLSINDWTGVARPIAAIPLRLSWTILSKVPITSLNVIIATSNTLRLQKVMNLDVVNDVDPVLHDLEFVWLPIIVARGGRRSPAKVDVIAVITRIGHCVVLAPPIIVVHVACNRHEAAAAG